MTSPSDVADEVSGAGDAADAAEGGGAFESFCPDAATLQKTAPTANAPARNFVIISGRKSPDDRPILSGPPVALNRGCWCEGFSGVASAACHLQQECRRSPAR